MPEEDLHLSDLARSQAHIPPALCRVVAQFQPKWLRDKDKAEFEAPLGIKPVVSKACDGLRL